MFEDRSFDDDPVVTSLLTQLENRYPDWRTTTHYAPTGQKVVMIEYADDQGAFVEGLPSEFVELIATAGIKESDRDG